MAPSRFHHHIVGAVQRAALEAVGDDRNAAVGFHPRHATAIVLAGDEAALWVPGQTVSAVGGLGEHRNPLTFGPLHASVVVDVAEKQEVALLPPDRSLGRTLLAAKTAGQFIDRLRCRNDPFQRGIVGHDGHGALPIPLCEAEFVAFPLVAFPTEG